MHQTIILPLLSPILTQLYNHPERLLDFLLSDFPTILNLHIETYWSARNALPLRDEPDPLKALGKAYHARLPLLSVSFPPDPPPPPVQGRPDPEPGLYALDPLYLTSMTDAILRLHLPPTEYASTAERTIIREIVGCMVLGSVGRRLSEPWFWWQIGLKALERPRAKAEAKRAAKGHSHPAHTHGSSYSTKLLALLGRIWTLLWAAWAMLTRILAILSAAPKARNRHNVVVPWIGLARSVLGVDGRMGISSRKWRVRIVWGFVEALITLTSPLIDRMVLHIILNQILTIETALQLETLLERILFPDGYPAVSDPDPTAEQAAALRVEFEQCLHTVMPKAGKLFLPTNGDCDMLLDIVGDRGCNAHLVGMIFDSVVAAVIPDLVVNEPVLSAGSEVLVVM
jgi:hypothetical protein